MLLSLLLFSATPFAQSLDISFEDEPLTLAELETLVVAAQRDQLSKAGAQILDQACPELGLTGEACRTTLCAAIADSIPGDAAACREALCAEPGLEAQDDASCTNLAGLESALRALQCSDVLGGTYVIRLSADSTCEDASAADLIAFRPEQAGALPSIGWESVDLLEPEVALGLPALAGW